MLEVRSLSLLRGRTLLWRNVSFVLGLGEMLEIRGSNGVGKTSLLKVVAGLIPSDSGKVIWQDKTVTEDINHYRDTMCYIGHRNALRDELSARENLLFLSSLKNASAGESSINQIATRLGIERFLDMPCGSLSEGQRRRVALSRLLLENATLWVLDEPLAALDNNGAECFSDMMEQHLLSGGMALVAAHTATRLVERKSRSLVLPDPDKPRT